MFIIKTLSICDTGVINLFCSRCAQLQLGDTFKHNPSRQNEHYSLMTYLHGNVSQFFGILACVLNLTFIV